MSGLRELQVPGSARGQRLDQYLASALEGLSRSRAAALVEGGHVSVEGAKVRPALRLRGGERLHVEIPPPPRSELKPERLPLSLLHEERSFVVVDKAPGVVVHPAAGNWAVTLVHGLLHRFGELGEGEAARPGLVHRLDKDTSGCLVVARTDAALAALQAAFKRRDVDKRYLALVHGQPRADEGRIETLYARHPRDRKRFTGKVKEGKPASTAWRVLERYPHAALLEVELLTGRTHQVRVHLSEAGWPLLADATYGARGKRAPEVAEAEAALGRQGLHAWRLRFAHPDTGERLAFEAPLPADLAAALAALRR